MIATHRAMAHPFAIDGDNEGRALLECVLASLVNPDGPRPEASEFYELHARGNHSQARRGGHLLYEGTLGMSMSHLMTAVNVAAIESVGQHPVVHAAVVVRDGVAIAIPGNPGAGKSTLCAALVAHGYTYVSDETAPILDDGRVLVYPKPIVVGPGSFEVLAHLRSADKARGQLDMWFLDPAALAGGIASSNPSLGAVVMPEYRPGAPVDVVRLTPGEMAALLASNMFNLRLLGRPALELVARLSAGLVGFRLIHGGVHGAVAAIDRLEIS